VIQKAKEKGYRWIYTGNERTNPMYTLNLQLGYRDCYEDITYWKEVN